MDFRLGLLISEFLLISVCSQWEKPSSHSKCTSLNDLALMCGCHLTKANFEPVCASDGQSYLNKCFAHCQETVSNTKITIYHKGACVRDQCTCYPDHRPVCASNGITYSNICVLNCYRKKEPSVYMKYEGKCKESYTNASSYSAVVQQSGLGGSGTSSTGTHVRKCYCQPARGPLCGSDGNTYNSYCEMRCITNDQAVFSHWGQCFGKSKVSFSPKVAHSGLGGRGISSTGTHVRKCYCQPARGPLCGSDGNTYNSYCEMRCITNDQAVFSHWGQCFGQAKVSFSAKVPQSGLGSRGTSSTGTGTHVRKCYCQPARGPLCGSDGNTYSSYCEMRCITNDQAVFSHWGQCFGQDPNTRAVEEASMSRMCECDSVHMPVCGSDGETYTNNCVLHCSSQIYADLMFKHWGPCTQQDKEEYYDKQDLTLRELRFKNKSHKKKLKYVALVVNL